MILGVHHPALAVPDMQQALDFYCGVIGFEQVMEADLPSGFEPMSQAFGVPDAGCKVRMVKKGNTCIELFEFNASEPGEKGRPVTKVGITHFALATDDIVNDFAHLEANGGEYASMRYLRNMIVVKAPDYVHEHIGVPFAGNKLNGRIGD